MKKEALLNVKAAFEANPECATLFANEAGHCFKNAIEGLVRFEKNEIDKLIAEAEKEEKGSGSAEGGNETKKPEDMTVKELTAALVALEVEVPKGAKKEDLVALLIEKQASAPGE